MKMAVDDRETYRRTWEDRLRGFDKDFNAWSPSRGANNNNIRDFLARRRDLDTRTSQMVDIAKNRWEGFKKDSEGALDKLESNFDKLKSKL
jgi:hypothetical protein